jgi:uncharacterized protein YceK
MRKGAACLGLALSFALTGCGTSLNLDGDSRPYGGVCMDAQKVRQGLVQAADPSKAEERDRSPVWNLALSACACVDLPLSVVGDTLTLPVTIATALDERYDQDPAVTQTVVTLEKPSGSKQGAKPPTP